MRHRGLSIVGGSLLLVSCSTAHPVLYPNAHMQSVGKEIAAQDIEACRKLAESAGAEEGTGEAGRVATSTVVEPEPALQLERSGEPSQAQ